MPDVQAESGTKVLVVDDDTLLRIALCRVFEKMGYATVDAGNGMQGLEIFAQEKPAIVVTDLQMPEKDGFDTIADMRAADDRVTIIAMSGGAGNLASLARARQLGADYTLPKPFSVPGLLDILDKLPSRKT